MLIRCVPSAVVDIGELIIFASISEDARISDSAADIYNKTYFHSGVFLLPAIITISLELRTTCELLRITLIAYSKNRAVTDKAVH